MKTPHSTAYYYCTTSLLAVVMMGMPAAVHAQNPNAALDPCSADGVIRDYNYPLHVAAVFIIMATSGLGAFIPLLAVRYPALRIPDWLITLGKHFGTGVILATGFIHMFPSAMVSLTSPCLSSAWNIDYPVYASLFAMFAALLMQLTEQLASENAEKRRLAAAAQEANDDASRAAVSVPIQLSSSSNHQIEKTSSHPHPHHHTHSEDEADLGSVIVDNDDSNVHSTVSTAFSAPVTSPTGSLTTLQQPRPPQEDPSPNLADVATELTLSHMHSHHTHVHSRANDHYPHHHHHHHDHPLGMHDHDHGILFLENERKKISTYILELGITSHSVIIGIALGVSAGGEFNGLLIALVFHQFFEGFALGARISEVYSHSLLAAIMSLIFTFTTPMGIVIGIGISSSYNPNSTAALLTQGIFDAVSAGILLYMAFVNLIAVEFTQNVRLRELKTSTKVSYYLAMYSGAGIMALIGRWA